MSYQDKLSRVLALIEEHNKNVGTEGVVHRVDPEAFTKAMKNIGATTEAGLAQCTWEDLQECGLPRILARQAASILRESNVVGDMIAAGTAAADRWIESASRAGAEAGQVVSAVRKKVKEMTYEELFARYQPSGGTGNDAVTEKLQALSKGRRCVVMVDGVVHAERSAKLLNELIRGYPEVEVTLINDKPVRVLKIGEAIDDVVDENPLWPGRALRPDGTCDQTNRSWEGVPHHIRQIVRLALDTGEIEKPLSVSTAHSVLDLVLTPDPRWPDGINTSRFHRALLKLEELKATGQAPVLKVKLSGLSSSGGRKQNPFVVA
jgi:hypothetical protein